MVWIIPNFGAVNFDTQLPPMTTRQKFVLATEDSVTDYSSYTWAGVLAGQASFNWSEVAGNGLEAGLSNAYYPPQERGLNQTALNFGTQIESAVLNHILQEFWPDIRKDLFRQK
jgi:hypothetical protein